MTEQGQPGVDQLLEQLRGEPADAELRERAARALEAEGRHLQAVELLTERLINLTAHEGPPLPCMCKQCLDPARIEAEEDGVLFQRDFSIASGRVLFYWVPRELHGDKRLRRSVHGRLEKKLVPKRRRR